MSDTNRRDLMKKLGAGSTAVGGLSGSVTALSEAVSPGNIENLTTREAYGYLIKSMDYGPVNEMRSYLTEAKQARIDTSGISGKRITPESSPTHVLLMAPLRTPRGGGGQLVVRVFDSTATATADIGGTVYKSNPDTVGSDARIATTRDQGVVTAQEWIQRDDSNDDQVAAQGDCDTTYGPVDAGGPLCSLVSGIALLAGAAAYVAPAPGGRIAGTFIVSSVVGGSCTIGEAIDDMLEGCNVTVVAICVNWNCHVDPISGVWCDTEVWFYSPDC